MHLVFILKLEIVECIIAADVYVLARLALVTNHVRDYEDQTRFFSLRHFLGEFLLVD